MTRTRVFTFREIRAEIDAESRSVLGISGGQFIRGVKQGDIDLSDVSGTSLGANYSILEDKGLL